MMFISRLPISAKIFLPVVLLAAVAVTIVWQPKTALDTLKADTETILDV